MEISLGEVGLWLAGFVARGALGLNRIQSPYRWWLEPSRGGLRTILTLETTRAPGEETTGALAAPSLGGRTTRCLLDYRRIPAELAKDETRETGCVELAVRSPGWHASPIG